MFLHVAVVDNYFAWSQGVSIVRKPLRIVCFYSPGLSSPLDGQDLKFLKNQKSFGSHDLQSQKVINTLKRVTFGLEDNDINHEETVAEEEEEKEEEGTSLDRPATVGNEWKLHTFPRLSSPRTSPLPSVKVRVPSSSPRTSPLPGVKGRRFTEGAETTGDWTKSRWRRTAVIRRRSQGHSVSSDSPTEKMVRPFSLAAFLLPPLNLSICFTDSSSFLPTFLLSLSCTAVAVTKPSLQLTQMRYTQ